MKQYLLVSVLSMGLLSACSTAFKAGQTPDDVYYSPGREAIETVRAEESQKQQEAQYQVYLSSLDDRYLRMKIANRYRWGSLDNFDYWYDSRYDFGAYNYGGYNGSYYYNTLNPYAFWNPGRSFGIGYGSGYGSGYGDGSWTNPIYTVVHYSYPKYSGGGSLSTSNITAFRNKGYSNSNYNVSNPKLPGYTPPNTTTFGSLIKRVFTGSGESASSYDRAARTFNDPAPTRTTTNPTPAPPPTSSSAGGNSGGFPSTGSSTSTGRGGKGG